MKLIAACRILPLLVFGLLATLAAPASGAADDVRFSASLTPAQRDRTGLSQLADDNVAVIDGLVRQDEAASKFKDNPVDHTRFSARRTARERELAGLDRLTPAQLGQLDTLVGQRISGTAPAPDGEVAAAGVSTVRPTAAHRSLEIHGEVSFTYGWGKGGSFSGGGIVLSYVDPLDRYAVLVGYSEFHGKGLLPCYYSDYGPGGGCIGPLPLRR
jgi:hypothetical protein